MPTYRGFVESLQVRDDGWVEVTLEAVHAGNTLKTFFIEDLDASLEHVHRRLGQLSLLRDALARVLPVEAEYRDDPEKGTLIEDLTIHPRPSIEGREGTSRVEGVVIGLSVAELGPSSGSSPYTDPPDVCAMTLLEDDGTVLHLLLDLQRPDPLTGQSILALLRKGFRTRRRLSLVVSGGSKQPSYDAVDRRSTDDAAGWIQTGEWIAVPSASLDEVHCFVERLAQRYESYADDDAPALSHVRVTYTTAPAQIPEGEVSENGTFAPTTADAWVHDDSPLLRVLQAGLRDRLMVILGLDGDQIHSVDLVGHLGSAARPIWIKVDRRAVPTEDAQELCDNTPTTQDPGASSFDQIPIVMAWCADGYFNEGIWRFVLDAPTRVELRVDGKRCPCDDDSANPASLGQETAMLRGGDLSFSSGTLCHLYLNGVHQVEILLVGRRCSDPFQFRAYRIR